MLLLAQSDAFMSYNEYPGGWVQELEHHGNQAITASHGDTEVSAIVAGLRAFAINGRLP